MRFGLEDSNAWALDSMVGVFATGSTCITVPELYYFWVLDVLVQDFGMNYTSNLGEEIYLTSCVI